MVGWQGKVKGICMCWYILMMMMMMKDVLKVKHSISQETTTGLGGTLTVLDRASFQLQSTIFLYSCHNWLCILARSEQEFDLV